MTSWQADSLARGCRGGFPAAGFAAEAGPEGPAAVFPSCSDAVGDTMPATNSCLNECLTPLPHRSRIGVIGGKSGYVRFRLVSCYPEPTFLTSGGTGTRLSVRSDQINDLYNAQQLGFESVSPVSSGVDLRL